MDRGAGRGAQQGRRGGLASVTQAAAGAGSGGPGGLHGYGHPHEAAAVAMVGDEEGLAR